jgi:hypothetical protein
MTARYVAGCCGHTVAEIEVSDDNVTISPPDGEELYRVQAPPRIEDPSLSGEQVALEYQARDKMHALVMNHTVGHHVSEVIWPDHSTWVIRCTCGQMLPVAQANLPRLGHVLRLGDWSKTGVLLGVLKAAMTRSDIY